MIKDRGLREMMALQIAMNTQLLCQQRHREFVLAKFSEAIARIRDLRPLLDPRCPQAISLVNVMPVIAGEFCCDCAAN